MAKYNPFDPANGYSEEDRLALNGKCASLINQAYKNPFPGTKIRLDGADNAGIFFAKQLAHVKTKPIILWSNEAACGCVYFAQFGGSVRPVARWQPE